VKNKRIIALTDLQVYFLNSKMRLSALRLKTLDILYAVDGPVTLALRLDPPLSDAQLYRLALASPLRPMAIEAEVNFDDYDQVDNSFRAEIISIESQPKIVTIKHRRTVGAKVQRRGMLGFV
jgi:hypothetical protein